MTPISATVPNPPKRDAKGKDPGGQHIDHQLLQRQQGRGGARPPGDKVLIIGNGQHQDHRPARPARSGRAQISGVSHKKGSRAKMGGIDQRGKSAMAVLRRNRWV